MGNNYLKKCFDEILNQIKELGIEEPIATIGFDINKENNQIFEIEWHLKEGSFCITIEENMFDYIYYHKIRKIREHKTYKLDDYLTDKDFIVKTSIEKIKFYFNK